jgi:hypothetical protein
MVAKDQAKPGSPLKVEFSTVEFFATSGITKHGAFIR